MVQSDLPEWRDREGPCDGMSVLLAECARPKMPYGKPAYKKTNVVVTF